MTHLITVSALDSGWVARLITLFGDMVFGTTVAAR